MHRLVELRMSLIAPNLVHLLGAATTALLVGCRLFSIVCYQHFTLELKGLTSWWAGAPLQNACVQYSSPRSSEEVAGRVFFHVSTSSCWIRLFPSACAIYATGSKGVSLCAFSPSYPSQEKSFRFLLNHIEYKLFIILNHVPKQFIRATFLIFSKAAKILAAKCTLAARVDSLHESPNGAIGVHLLEQVRQL